MSQQPFFAKKCGVRFNPPAIVLLYQVKATGKVHRRTMPLRHFTKNSGVTRCAEELKTNQRHRKYLESVSLPQLEKLIALIRDKLNGLELDTSLKKNKSLDTLDPDEDLNRVDEKTLQRKKAIMDSMFERHRKQPGDPDFQYDVEVDFAGGAIETCDWDSNDDTDNEF